MGTLRNSYPTMEVLAMIGSPRKQRNTGVMADEVLKGAGDAGATTSRIYLDDYFVRPIAEVADNTRKRDDPRRDISKLNTPTVRSRDEVHPAPCEV